MSNPCITYVARVHCKTCQAAIEVPANPELERRGSYSGCDCTAENGCDLYSVGWHDCGDYVLCPECW